MGYASAKTALAESAAVTDAVCRFKHYVGFLSLSFFLFLVVVVSALYRKCGARRMLHDARSVNVFSLLLTNFDAALLSLQPVMPLHTHSPELRKRDEVFCGSTKISTRYMHSSTLLVLLLVAVIKRTNQTRNMLRDRIPLRA